MAVVDFKETFLHMNVLCASKYLDYIFAGIGNHLFIYRKKLIQSRPIFTDERIHSILIHDDWLLLKGCRKLSLLRIKLKSSNIDMEVMGNIQCSDFIQDVIITNDKLVGLVTAHNCFQLWDLTERRHLQTQQCAENCILYSCKITGHCIKTITVFGGTVFGDVLIWSPTVNSGEPMKRLKAHNGAVFSIEVAPHEKLLTTTSDDRSLKIWSVESPRSLLNPQTWKDSSIRLTQTLFGHTARVWKSLILDKYFVTIGEDSQLILWSREGEVVRAVSLHQESGIRGLHHSKGTITTGGEDGGVNTFSVEWLISPAKPVSVCVVPDGSTKVCFTGRGIVYCVNGTVMLDNEAIYQNDDFGSYSVLEVSPVYIIMGSIKGRLVVLNIETKSVHVDEQVVDGRIYSIHWLENCLLTCGPEGRLDVWSLDGGLKKVRTMTLPPSKERWTTCAIIQLGMLILGDRMGSVHVFDDDREPVKSFPKIHSYLGVTDIKAAGEEGWVSAGRDGTVKTFANLTHSLTCKLPMDWPWRIVRHNSDTLILGFRSVLFIVWSMNNREIIASHDCGGGHRSCDFQISNNDLKFLYVKDKKVQIVDLSLNQVARVRNGYHGKEINCLKILKARAPIILTGSEDTTVRISAIESDIHPLQVLTCHISSVRAVKALSVNSHEHLIASVGGKGQIVLFVFDADTKRCEMVVNHRLKTEARNWKTPTPCIDPETRIMCVDIERLDKGYVIAAGCSDCYVRLFDYDEEFRESRVISYTHCILKVKFVGGLLASAGTDGKVVFWDYSNAAQLKSFRLHQSGVNSFEFEELGRGRFLLVTGGDDNLICVSQVEISEKEVNLIQLWRNSETHSCQITGIKILNDFILTTSIDQRITLWKWTLEDDFQMGFVSQVVAAVPDIQGMDATWGDADQITAIVHGKGVQVVTIDLRSWIQAHG